MNKKQKLIPIFILVILTGLWAVLSFTIQDSLISRFSLWASLIFGTGSLAVSFVALVVSVDSNRKAEALRLEKLSEDANKFIIRNYDEIIYIPLCLVANAYDNHHKFKRKIYNEFNKLNRELQKEILKQLNYDYELITNNDWIDRGIDKVKNFVETNDLGKDWLYDGGKYFYRSIMYSDEPYNPTCEYGHVMPDNFHLNSKIVLKDDKPYQENISFYDYVDSYLRMKKKNDPLYIAHKNDKPLDVLTLVGNLPNCDETNACYWVMEIVSTMCAFMEKEFDLKTIKFYSKSDAEIQTFEDRYLDVLMKLYNLSLCYKATKNIN